MSVASTKPTISVKKGAPWYLGGIASIGAVCVTHPLDLIKVQLQTQQKSRLGFVGMTTDIIKKSGVLTLYNGLSAAILRQATYSTTRFAMYETLKPMVSKNDPLTGRPMEISFVKKIALAGLSGFTGGCVGTPADLANVRMQNDSKLPVAERRNYKHAGDALVRIVRGEGGPQALFKGMTMAATRGGLVTIGQLAFYDEVKSRLLATSYFADSLATHFTASLTAGAGATCITMPLDVLKTRMMNAKPGEYKSIVHCARGVFESAGARGFFKGFTPAFVRLGPHTVLTFVFLEQLKKVFV